MDTIVLIKQVPEIGEAKIDSETGTLNRQGIPLIVNPIDFNAIELALQIKERCGGSIRVLTMGPVFAEKALREALALGCDEAFLLTGSEFAASDTYATSYALAQCIIKLKPWDIIIAGEKAIDGDTGQVGPGVASFLDIPIVTYAIQCQVVDQSHFFIERTIETGIQKITIKPPFLITVTKGINNPRFPTLKGKVFAHQRDIKRINAESLSLTPEATGYSGSPTRVVKVENYAIERKGEILKDRETIEMVNEFIRFLSERGAL